MPDPRPPEISDDALTLLRWFDENSPRLDAFVTETGWPPERAYKACAELVATGCITGSVRPPCS